MRARRSAPFCLLAAALVLAGCGGGGSSGSGTASGGPSSASSGGSPSSASSSATGGSGTSASSDWGHLAGCPSVGRQIPQGTTTKQTVDVDGDGRPDTAWIATQPDSSGGIAFGARTASGGFLAATIHSASPVARSVLFADVTGHGEVIALASDGRQVLLYAVSECQLIPVKNLQGKQYAFDLGFTGYGTGVGCVDADSDGTTDLVGLKYVPESQGAGTIQRTIVRLSGNQARNGATDTVPATNANMADEAQSVSCGDLTLAADGVSSGP